jgi:hypothetical protein
MAELRLLGWISHLHVKRDSFLFFCVRSSKLQLQPFTVWSAAPTTAASIW